MERIFESPYYVAMIAVECFAAIVGILCLKKYGKSKMRYFIYLLIGIVIFTITATYTYSVRYNGVLSFLEETRFRHNYWLGTLCWDISAKLIYAWFFSLFISNRSYKKTIRILSYMFLIFSILLIVFKFDQYFLSELTEIEIGGSVLLILTIMFYFLDILKSDTLLIFYKSYSFYIASILFVWLLVTIPLSFYEPYFTIDDPAYVRLRGMIYFYVNFLMYIGFALVLLFGKPETLGHE